MSHSLARRLESDHRPGSGYFGFTPKYIENLPPPRILIPDLKTRLKDYFPEGQNIVDGLKDCPFGQFGAVFEPPEEIYIDLFDENFVLFQPVKDLIRRHGVCLMRNVRLTTPLADSFQKNIFPDLSFHVDRAPVFQNQYSLFYRNPSDEVQRHPRKSSTLILPNEAARAQGTMENVWGSGSTLNVGLFKDGTLSEATGKILIEHPWNAPVGTGEICIFDNRTVMHASYYREEKGYPISVQYLS